MRLFLLGSRDLKGISEILDGIVVLRIRYGQALASRPHGAVRVVGLVAILTAASRTISSRNAKESQAHFRLVAVYGQEGDAIRLVHFQSTMIIEKAA
jgi:hypothetical protein